MQQAWWIAIILSFTGLQCFAEESRFKFEGILGAPSQTICNMNENAKAFIPYNPIVIEVGAYQGQGTCALAQSYPYGKIFAFEANPNAYLQLQENTKDLKNVFPIQLAIGTSNSTTLLWGDNEQASLFLLQKNIPRTKVLCSTLDNWCANNGIDHVDFIRLDVNGLEAQILEKSPKILQTTLVVVIKTHMAPLKSFILAYPEVKRRMENYGFELLSHWYEEGKQGEATFVRKYLYDSLFR